MTADPTRPRDLKLIHAARRQMAWDDNTSRAILERVTGKSSAADLNAKERKAVLDDFARLGWRVKTRKGHRKPGTVGLDRQKLVDKIEAYLSEAKLPWAYADAMAKRICKVDSVRFCEPDQLHKLVAALEYDQRRRRAKSGTGDRPVAPTNRPDSPPCA